MKALIDGDIVVFRCGFASEYEPEAIAKSRLDITITRIWESTQVDDAEIYLSDKKENNYRYTYLPTYKANRTKPLPKHFKVLKDHLINKHSAIITSGQEADDALGIAQCSQEDTIICTIDKDLKQIPGQHYHFVDNKFDMVSKLEGLYNFYEQLLVGDRADNVFGVSGIGKVKANKALRWCVDEDEMFTTVRELYEDDDRLLINGRVLWVRRKPNEIWEFPK